MEKRGVPILTAVPVNVSPRIDEGDPDSRYRAHAVMGQIERGTGRGIP